MKTLGKCFVAAMLLLAGAVSASAAEQKVWTDHFPMNKKDLSITGANPYFILRPGYQLHFKSQDGDLTITVLNETKSIDGVQTRVVEERETERGKLTEVSRNYYAISKATNTVFYFGEDVDTYDRTGKVTSHGGGWRAGVKGAKAGVMMPGAARLGARYYEEVAPGAAMDRAEIVSLTESLRVPAGVFKGVLKTEETTPLEPGAKEYKFYAPGVGLLQDGDLKLDRHGFVKSRYDRR